jgi:hypothetical protein
MNIFELTKIHKRKQQNRIKLYDDMLNQCHLKILSCSKSNKTTCNYRVPRMKFGTPLYNQKACIAYMMLKLRKNGFNAKYVNQDYIHVSWTKHKQDCYFDKDVLAIEQNPASAERILREMNREQEEQEEQLRRQARQSQPDRPRTHSYQPSLQQLRNRQPRYQHQQQQPRQISHGSGYESQFQSQQQIGYNEPLTIEYVPEDNVGEKSGVHSTSYMTKYYKDLNSKYLMN